MIFSVWTRWIRAKGKEMKNRKKRSSDMKRNENSGTDIKRNEISGTDIKRNENSGGYGAVNKSASTSVSGITELLISVNKNLDRLF